MATNPKPQRAIHRTITLTIETIQPLPTVRTLPPETLVPLNLKGNGESGEKLIAEIKKQMKMNEGGFWAVFIEGIS